MVDRIRCLAIVRYIFTIVHTERKRDIETHLTILYTYIYTIHTHIHTRYMSIKILLAILILERKSIYA